MTEPKELGAAMEQVWRGDAEGEAAQGPALRVVLKGVDAAVASRRAAPGAPTIWEILLHLRAGLDGFCPPEGVPSRRLETREDWWPPAPAPSPEAWEEALRGMDEAQDRCARRIGGMTAEQVSKPHGYPQFLLHHLLHHGGQVALLKRLLVQA